MKHLILVFALQFCATIVNAQDQLICRVICVAGDATIDNFPIKVGQKIFSNRKKISVRGKDSFVGLIMANGYAYKLDSGNYDIDCLEKFIRSKKYEPKPVAGTANRSAQQISFYGLPGSFGETPLVGDTLSITWKMDNVRWPPPYTFSISTRFHDKLLDTVVTMPSFKINVRSWLDQERGITFKVASTHWESFTEGVRLLDEIEAKLLAAQLVRIVAENDVERKIIRTAVLEVFNFHYDVLHQLYDSPINTSNLAGDLKNYYAELAKHRSKILSQ